MLEILEYSPYEGAKSFMGTFSVRIPVWGLTVKGMSLFKGKNGNLYVRYPSKKKKGLDDKWEHDFSYVRFEGKVHEKFQEKCIQEIKKNYLKDTEECLFQE